MVELKELLVIAAPIERCFNLARSVEVHLSGNVHYGEQAVATAGVTSGLIGLGQEVSWRARHFGIRQILTSKITELNAPNYFQDVMLRGAFKSMKHDHYFRRMSPGLTEMKDVFVFEAPIPLLGLMAETLVLRRYMQALLRERNRVLKEIAEGNDWEKYLCES